MPDANEYGDSDTKPKPIIRMKGAEDKFKMQWGRIPGGKMNDMKLVQMFIKWNNTFNEENPAK